MDTQGTAHRPNVLLVTVDQWPGPLLGAAGHRVIRTPTLDALGRAGTLFPRAYSESPVCVPARRSLMTGTSPKAHGDRSFQERLNMPELPTLAGTFRDAGYQTFAAGKLHVYPQRNRIGFDDVALAEEGRIQFGVTDDYETFLADAGYPGQGHGHGLSSNGYETRPWHLPEHCHPTNWTTRQLVRAIKRRDPTRPAFWYLSYNHPHPPLAPLASYAQIYENVEVPLPAIADWARDESRLPGLLLTHRHRFSVFAPEAIEAGLRAFYALCTHIDHQLRLVIGTLREAGLLDNTVVLVTGDHGDMLGHHGFWAKRVFYEPSARIPMLLVEPAGRARAGINRSDDRLVGLQDVMPTLLDLAGISIPGTVTGRSLLGEPRAWLYGEINEGIDASRMIREGDWKLIYYPEGNLFQLFNLREDPDETTDLSASAEHVAVLDSLQQRLRGEIYGADLEWLDSGRWVGLPHRGRDAMVRSIHEKARGLINQRGLHWPP